MIGRRALLAGLGLSGLAACVPIDQSPLGRINAKLRIIEAASGGTLGVAIYQTLTGVSAGLNRFERFGHCSSFKLSLAAMLLSKDASGAIDADELVRWTKDDLLSHAPFTTERLGQGATLRELARAAQVLSDNTATNLLLQRLGGPEGMTAFWREIGDVSSRLDRFEPELNNVPAGEVRDTTTPDSMARTVARLLFGNVLDRNNRATLLKWTVDTATGLQRVRAGLPSEWSAGDKTGTSNWPGMQPLYVDIGWVEPAGHPPTCFAVYHHTKDGPEATTRANLVMQQVGEVIADFATA